MKINGFLEIKAEANFLAGKSKVDRGKYQKEG